MRGEIISRKQNEKGAIFMAQNKREEKAKSIGKLTVDVDTSDAITALKALQRTARETTKALREVEEAQVNPWYLRYNKSDVVRSFSTQELADELARREGVATREIQPMGNVDIAVNNVNEGDRATYLGPAKVLVISE
jgi:alkylated DNA nucleotide flippase Atl1